ncbi:MAG: PqiC family protein [Desulfobacteraceae bacterium]|jgi:uncharacterized lipoprotein YmbA
MKPVSIFTGVMAAIGISIAFILLTACHNTSRVAFYTLNAQISHQSNKTNSVELNNIAVGIGSIHLPTYLDRPQIVTLKGVSQLHLAEFHRWAGPLDGEIAQVMMNNLSNLLGTSQVIIYPWTRSQTPEFRLDLTFQHFEGTLGDTMRIQGVWRLFQNTPKGVYVHQPFDHIITIKGMGYENLVTACNQGLWNLSKDISLIVQRKLAMSTHN